MNKEERNALVSFLVIYVGSAVVLMSIIAILYYNKEMTAIEDRCSIEMKNAALSVEKELMSAHMDKREYTFTSPNKDLQVGLFDQQGNKLYSNLKQEEVYLSKEAYKTSSHEYYVDTLKHTVSGVKHIVIEGNESFKERMKLLALIAIVILVSAVFVGYVGHYLSRLLIAPIKNRMLGLNAFIKDGAHELNTPVSALMMSVSSLKSKERVDERVLNHISISAKLISQIYNSLSFIAFHERDEIYDEYFDLASLIQESVKFFEDIAKNRGNSIVVELESTEVFMDRSRIQKVINNLISNALKYSFANTEILITLKNAIFTIENRGSGIALKDQEAIFERFERKNTTEGGFGIGLDIVKSVCKHYGIEVKVYSKRDEKTVFTLVFTDSPASLS